MQHLEKNTDIKCINSIIFLFHDDCMYSYIQTYVHCSCEQSLSTDFAERDRTNNMCLLPETSAGILAPLVQYEQQYIVGYWPMNNVQSTYICSIHCYYNITAFRSSAYTEKSTHMMHLNQLRFF